MDNDISLAKDGNLQASLFNYILERQKVLDRLVNVGCEDIEKTIYNLEPDEFLDFFKNF